jgi:acyl-CoA thioester hydrolase
MPTVEQVRELPALFEMTIPPEWQDLNGHVNVQHYLGIYDRSGWPLMAWLGIDESRFKVDRIGFFDLEHHIWYLAEMHVGDVVTAHTRFYGRSAKRFHGALFIVNKTRESLASVLEFVTTGANLDTRRSSALPEDVAERVGRLLDEHSRLTWPAPRCGSIGA